MLGGVKLKVAYTHEKTCFAYISPKYSTNNEQVIKRKISSWLSLFSCYNLLKSLIIIYSDMEYFSCRLECCLPLRELLFMIV